MKKSKTRVVWQKDGIARKIFSVGVIVVLVILWVIGGRIESQRLAVVEKSIKVNNNTPIVTSPPISPQAVKTRPHFPINEPEKLSGFCLKVPVIYYHHIEPDIEAVKNGQKSLAVDSEEFDSQMKYLHDRGYNTLKADDLVSALINHQNLPPKTIVVTIDDGYSDAYQYAFPVAKKYNIILNLMIPTGLMENSGYLTWNNLQEMTGSGLVFAYNHTWSHFALPRGDDAKIISEVMTAQKQLKEYLGTASPIITYPYGSFNDKVANILRANGFIAAFSTQQGTYACDSSIMALRRIRVGGVSLSHYGL